MIRSDSMPFCDVITVKHSLRYYYYIFSLSNRGALKCADVCFRIGFHLFGEWIIFELFIIPPLQITVLLVELIFFCNQSHVYANALLCAHRFWLFFGIVQEILFNRIDEPKSIDRFRITMKLSKKKVLSLKLHRWNECKRNERKKRNCWR